MIETMDKSIAKKDAIKKEAPQKVIIDYDGLLCFSDPWVEKKIGTIGICYNGLSGKTKEDFGVGDCLYITFLNVLNNPILDINMFEKVRVGHSEKQNKAQKYDLFFNTSSETPEEVGICSVLLSDVEDLYLNSFCFGFRTTDSQVYPLYLAYFFRSKNGRDLMSALAQGITRYNISKKSFTSGKILIPSSITEQRAIASALSDVDLLIRALDKLIAKKEAVKRGTMRQLLTGHKRLPGFSAPWVERRLGDVASMNSGGTPSAKEPTYYGGNIPFLSIGDMTAQGKWVITTEKTITELGLNCSSARVCSKGTLLYAMYASLGKCSIAKIDLAISQAVLGIAVDERILNNNFLYYLLCFIESSVQSLGQQGTQKNLSKRLVQDFILTMPNTSEQRAIAEVLTDMDNEIEALRKKKEKYEKIKQGMMQQLLTGRIRLIDD